MDSWLLIHAFWGPVRDLITFHSLLIKGIIGGTLFFWVLNKA